MFEEVEVNSERWLSLENLKSEKWKEIPNTEGNYFISNYGRLKTKEKKVRSGLRNNLYVTRKEQIIKNQINKLGYNHISIKINGILKNVNIHRMVAILFIPNPQKKEQVGHKDENPKNNRVDNLIWQTAKENINWGTRNKKCSKTMLNKKSGIKVEKYDLNGNFIERYDSIRMAAKENNMYRNQISSCCKGIYKKSNGYIWKYGNK